MFGSEVVRGLFQDGRQGNQEPKPKAPLVKAEVKVNTPRTVVRGLHYSGPSYSNNNRCANRSFDEILEISQLMFSFNFYE